MTACIYIYSTGIIIDLPIGFILVYIYNCTWITSNIPLDFHYSIHNTYHV